MEYSQQIRGVGSAEANAALANANRFVKMTSGKLAYCAAGEKSCGVILDPADSGEMANYAVYGSVVRVTLGGTVAAMEHVTSDANGKAVKTDYIQFTNVSSAATLFTADTNLGITVPVGMGAKIPAKNVNGIALIGGDDGDVVPVLVM